MKQLFITQLYKKLYVWYNIINKKEEVEIVSHDVGDEQLVSIEASGEEGSDEEEVSNEYPEEGFISSRKLVDINKLRATDLPYNPTVKMPWSIGELEVDIHRFKRDVDRLASQSRNYTAKRSNLDKARRRGL